DGGGYTRLGGYVKQISVGLDADGYPEVYGIGLDDALYAYKGGFFANLGGYVKAISATAKGTVYVIGGDDSVFVHLGTGGFTSLGGYALQISAGLNAAGNAEVYAIGSNNGLFVNSGGGFVNLGGYVKQISATVKGTVYAIGGDDAAYINVNGGGF